ncbi:MAG: hypothetical protein IJW42_01105 [Alistipes sp.]|nr:hypothetical protein [Alistipes sp.]
MWHNILITSCGKRVALTISVKKTLTSFFPEGKVFTSDACPEYAPAGYFSDKCFQVPRVTSEDYIDTLLDICFKYKVGLIIPTIDTELAILARNKDVFAKHGIALIVSDISFINIIRYAYE